MCRGLGFLVGKNEDGFIAAVSEKIASEEGSETPQVMLKPCTHGIFEQNVNDFNF